MIVRDALSINSFMVFPLSMLMLICLVYVVAAVRGRFHPPHVFLRGLGGAIFMLGYGLCSVNRMNIDHLNGGIMIWGLAICAIPRLIEEVKGLSPEPRPSQNGATS